ncbi:MAG: ABC transporter permease subunit, partial [Clostridia bacterium]|nr:ABC transporter permease subunit [Clostridia bacterium]
WMDRVMAFITLLPFALQGVILAVGLIKIYSSGPLIISGTIYILTGAYFVVILPYMYQGIKNSIDSLDVDTLIQAASLLGASESYAFFKVVLPNLLKGVTVSTLLSFAILIGEFVLSNILVGGNYETVQVYMYWSRGVSGHYSSAIIISYFVFVVFISGVVLYINELEAKKG